jgi:hypothetical protein
MHKGVRPGQGLLGDARGGRFQSQEAPSFLPSPEWRGVAGQEVQSTLSSSTTCRLEGLCPPLGTARQHSHPSLQPRAPGSPKTLALSPGSHFPRPGALEWPLVWLVITIKQ